MPGIRARLMLRENCGSAVQLLSLSLIYASKSDFTVQFRRFYLYNNNGTTRKTVKLHVMEQCVFLTISDAGLKKFEAREFDVF